jgi:hypothetical protein
MPRIEAILEAFFQHAPVRQRAHLIGYAGWHVAQNKHIAAEALQRIMELVDHRVSAVLQLADAHAREELSEWASICRAAALPDAWVLSVAKRIVPVVPGTHSAMWVGDRLATAASADLSGALEVLHAVSVKDLGPMGIYDWIDPAHEILSRAVAKDSANRQMAIATINNFTERGYGQFEKHLPT